MRERDGGSVRAKRGKTREKRECTRALAKEKKNHTKTKLKKSTHLLVGERFHRRSLLRRAHLLCRAFGSLDLLLLGLFCFWGVENKEGKKKKEKG